MLCEEYVTATLEVARNLPALQSETLQAELAVVDSNFELGMAKVREKQGAVQKKASRFEKILASVEGFVDAGDAVKRRRRSNLIYQDLVDERISIERAAMELQALNKRQKGGWLQQKLLTTQRSFSRNVSGFVMRRVK